MKDMQIITFRSDIFSLDFVLFFWHQVYCETLYFKNQIVNAQR